MTGTKNKLAEMTEEQFLRFQAEHIKARDIALDEISQMNRDYFARTLAAIENPKPTIALRDYFAGAALTNSYAQHEGSPDKVAQWAYEIADAMLAAKEVRP